MTFSIMTLNIMTLWHSA